MHQRTLSNGATATLKNVKEEHERKEQAMHQLLLYPVSSRL